MQKSLSSQMTEAQTELFYLLWIGLLQFTNESYKIIPEILGNDFSIVDGINTDHAHELSDFIWTKPSLLNDFSVAKKLDARQSEIILSWQKHYLKGKFYIVKHLKNGTVLLSADKEEKPYLIKGLISPISELFPEEFLPTMTSTALLPFEGDIIANGIFSNYTTVFGAGISRDIKESCQRAELAYGLITALPDSQIVGKADRDIARIKFYLKSVGNLNNYSTELADLVREDPALDSK